MERANCNRKLPQHDPIKNQLISKSVLPRTNSPRLNSPLACSPRQNSRRKDKKNINFIHLPLGLSSSAAALGCHNHLPPTLIELARTLPFPSYNAPHLSERLCAHHQFKWFSLSTAFLKYLPESEAKRRKYYSSMDGRSLAIHIFPIIMLTPDSFAHSKATHNSTARSNRRANERAAHEQQQKQERK